MLERDEIRELLKKVRRLHIKSRKAVADYMAGQFKSTFKGAGIEFYEVRDYQEGDEVDCIDWNVTARSGKLQVKTFAEEREQSVVFLVDASLSNAFGSGRVYKSDTIAELCALVCFSALTNNDKVGMLLFSDHVERHIPLGKGTRHGLRLIRELVGFKPKGQGTCISAALSYLVRSFNRRAVVFLVSDFLDDGFDQALAVAARKHDLIAINVTDPRERVLKGQFMMRLRDLETDARLDLDFGAPHMKDGYTKADLAAREALKRLLSSKGVDLLNIEAGADCAPMLRTFFSTRMKRRVL